MCKQSFLIDLAVLLEVEVDDLQLTFDLQRSAAWDSLSVVSTIALLDEHFGLNVGVEHLENCHTVGDLLSLASRV